MNNYSTFKVIKIIDEYSIVINGGIEEDVSKGDKIEVYLEGDDIFNPDTNEKLGTLDYIKETLQVTEVYRKFSVCEKIIKKEVFQPSAFATAMRSFAASTTNQLAGTKQTEISRGKINIDSEQITGRKTGDKTIRIGDIARIPISN